MIRSPGEHGHGIAVQNYYLLIVYRGFYSAKLTEMHLRGKVIIHRQYICMKIHCQSPQQLLLFCSFLKLIFQPTFWIQPTIKSNYSLSLQMAHIGAKYFAMT